MARAVFVIGTGRSGTHWLGYQLDKHPDVETTIEDRKIFSLVTERALDFGKRKKLYPKLVRRYKKNIKRTKSAYYADKSHPNIWLVEDLSRDLPGSRYIGIVRNPYATIASMLKHSGVRAWHSRWREFGVPNPFLGITTDMVDSYEDMSLTEKCFLRWLSHYDRMQDLKGRTDMLVISYENFALKQEETLRAMQVFLELKSGFYPMEVKTESLSKWEADLSEEDKTTISRLLEGRGVTEYN